MKKPNFQIIIDIFEGRQVALVVKDKKPWMVYAKPAEGEQSNPGAVFAAKFTEKTHDSKIGFLTSTATGVKYFCQNMPANLSVGDVILVQTTKLYREQDDKSSIVTALPIYKGRYLVYMPHDKGIHVSKKIEGNIDKSELFEKIPAFHEGGWILRSSYHPEQISDELMRQEADSLLKFSKDEHFEGYDPISRALIDFGTNANLEIIANEDFKGALTEKLSFYAPELSDIVSFTEAPIEELGHDLFLEDLLDLETVLVSNGALHFSKIPEGPAFIDIDLDLTKEAKSQKSLQEICGEIMRYIRLKNYAGIILIDFPRMENRKVMNSILEMLKTEAGRDPVNCRVFDFTKVGYVEMIRDQIDPLFLREE